MAKNLRALFPFYDKVFLKIVKATYPLGHVNLDVVIINVYDVNVTSQC